MVLLRVRSLLLTFLFLIALLAVQPGVVAQNPTTCDTPGVGCCGDITLILLNPDLQPDSQGFIRASGDLFAQFQAIGAGADEIANFGFSFGVHVAEFPEDVCQLPPQAWYTGQQIINYRADTDASDGFMINLQTGLVPDGEYTAALHAYDANDNELARFWTSAIVSNCDTATIPGTPVERCGDDAEQMLRNDFVMPWPIVLPGDGLTTADVNGFTIEFAEAVQNLTVTLNGEDITDQLVEWDGRLWDDDLRPGYGPYGLAAILVPECEGPAVPQLNECSHLGIAYEWTQRPLTQDDVLRVEAQDLAGNIATKDLHIGSGVTSGAIAADLPVLEWAVDTSNADVDAGQSATFAFTITNRGGAQGHPFADQHVPAGWDYQWNPPHVPVDSGAAEPQEFIVKVPADALPGPYQVTALMNYSQQGVIKTLHQPLTVTVAEPEGFDPDAVVDEDPEEASPSLGLLLAFAAVAFVAARRRD